MKCADVEARLSAYLDAELSAELSSAVRGHLRACDACRALAEDHAHVIGALASLPPAEPPPALWAAVERGLAAAETVDARRSPWSLGGARLWARLRPHLVPAAALAAAAGLAVVVIESRRGGDAPSGSGGAGQTPQAPGVASGEPGEPSPGSATAPGTLSSPPDPGVGASPPAPSIVQPKVDIDVALAAERARLDDVYRAAVAELAEAAAEERAGWRVPEQRAFDARIAALTRTAELADDVEARERAWQALVSVLQRVALGERVAEVRR